MLSLQKYNSQIVRVSKNCDQNGQVWQKLPYLYYKAKRIFLLKYEKYWTLSVYQEITRQLSKNLIIWEPNLRLTLEPSMHDVIYYKPHVKWLFTFRAFIILFLFLIWSPLVRGLLFWPPFMVYISVIITHILHFFSPVSS